MPGEVEARTRAERRDIYEIADGNPENLFVTITARIGSGRDEATRTRLGKALLDAFGFPFRKGEMPASTKKSRGAAKRSLKK